MSHDRTHPIRQLAALLRPHKLVLTGVLACLVLLVGLDLAMPRLLGYVIDVVFEEGAGPGDTAARLTILGWVLLAVLGVYVFRNALFYIAKPQTIAVGENAAFDLRQQLIRHLHMLSVDFYQRSNPGKISARVMQDVNNVKQFVQDELANVMINVLMLVVAAAIMFYMDWLLAVVTLAIMPFHVLVYYVFRRPIAAYAREASERTADVSGNLVEQFDAGGAATVKAAATQLLEQEKLRRSMRRSMAAQIKQYKFHTLQKVAADLLVGVGTIVLFGVGGYLVVSESMTSGEFVTFCLYVKLLYPRLLELVSQTGKFTRAAMSLERVNEILDIEPGVKERDTAIPAEIPRGRIEFRDVTFGYLTAPVLRDVSLTIEPGHHVLVLGPSGAGKSTLVNLIPRFRDPQAGAILIDGTDVRDFTLNSLRRQVGFVFQDCFLFNDTVMANIRYAWPQATDEQVVEAAVRSFAAEFIEKLPDGYMTVIGEGGIHLSAGQRRRITIARAILKDPRILIMDEPLVSLDPEARRQAIDGLAVLVRNRTVLTITHYPDQLPGADRQILVRDGRATVRNLSGRAVPSG
jgi:ABC-type multidrug transport system fused ATPase/permease subunit